MRVRPALLGLAALCGCAEAQATPPQAALDADTLLGTPISFKNLTLIPLVARTVDTTDYLALDEGMDKGLVKVRERGQGGSVNQVELENRADRPLFLMAGEVILGGKQDRVIGQDTVVPARQKLEVPVFCVEHGRWTNGDTSFRSGKAMAHSKLRAKAKFEGQGQVWKEVKDKNAKRGTENATDTYRQVATGETVEKAIAPYAAHFEAVLARAPQARQTVGFVMVLNGKIMGLERFRTPRLLAKVQKKLLRSYFVGAVDAPVEAPRPAPTAADVKAFVAKADAARKQQVLDNAASTTEEQVGEGGVKASTVRDKAAPAKPAYQSYTAE